MADEDEERALEEQLQFQLHEQKESLAAVADALSSDPSNHELLSVNVELVQSIKDAEEGLFHLKKARLLREADSVLEGSVSSDVRAGPLGPTNAEAESLVDQGFSNGSKCRFRYTNGRWYNGLIVGLEGSESAKISFLIPTSESMLMCKFFLQQRCRFGSSCRLSHGIDVPLSSMKKYIPTSWEQSMVGSTIWALSDHKLGIWKEAELQSWDENLKTGVVIFRANGSSTKLGTESIVPSQYAHTSSDDEEEESYASSDQLDSSEHEDDSWEGLGFLESAASQKGVQTDTAIFARWENHTRGIASRMMANMGYREGMGLGASGQGIVDPISVKVLPPKQSLGHALKIGDNEETRSSIKKRSRGGKRKRDKRLAAAIKTVEDEESEDVFTLINNQLANKKRQQSKTNGETKIEDRRTLLAYEDEMKNLKGQIGRLEEMANRNRKEKVVYDAAMKKLSETRKALMDAEVAHSSTSNAVVRKEKEKKWLKF